MLPNELFVLLSKSRNQSVFIDEVDGDPASLVQAGSSEKENISSPGVDDWGGGVGYGAT